MNKKNCQKGKTELPECHTTAPCELKIQRFDLSDFVCFGTFGRIWVFWSSGALVEAPCSLACQDSLVSQTSDTWQASVRLARCTLHHLELLVHNMNTVSIPQDEVYVAHDEAVLWGQKAAYVVANADCLIQVPTALLCVRSRSLQCHVVCDGAWASWHIAHGSPGLCDKRKTPWEVALLRTPV